MPPLPGEAGEGDLINQTLVIIPRNCTGCRTCEVACSFTHSSSGRLGRSRIRVLPVGLDRHVQITCLQCVEAACVKVCPTKALVRNPATRAIEVAQGRCIGCGLCETACPFGHMHFDDQTRLPVKCDLCGGRPACALFCPYRALELR